MRIQGSFRTMVLSFGLVLSACGLQQTADSLDEQEGIEEGSQPITTAPDPVPPASEDGSLTITPNGNWVIYLPGGYCWVRGDRRRAGVCDTRADNRGVTNWYASDGGGGNVGDYNGSAPPCAEEGPDAGGLIRHFHCCVGGTCSPERYF